MRPLIWFLFLALAVPAFGADIPKADSKTIVLSADPWCPWNCDGVSETGIGVDLIKTIFEPLGYKIEYKPMPWTRAIAETAAGRVHGLVGADHLTPETKDFVFPGEPIGKMNNIFLIAADSKFEYKDQKSLENKKIGIVADYHFGGDIGKYIDDNYENAKVVEQVPGSAGAEQNIKKVASGRIDLYVDESFVVQYVSKKSGLESKVKVGGALNDGAPIFVAFSPVDPRSKELAKLFDAGMKKINAEGSYQKILAKYNVASASASAAGWRTPQGLGSLAGASRNSIPASRSRNQGRAARWPSPSRSRMA